MAGIIKSYGSTEYGEKGGYLTAQINKVKLSYGAEAFEIAAYHKFKGRRHGFILTLDELFALNDFLSKDLFNELGLPDGLEVKLRDYANDSYKAAKISANYGSIPTTYSWPLKVCRVYFYSTKEWKYDLRRWAPDYKNYGEGMRFDSMQWDKFIEFLHFVTSKIHTEKFLQPPKPKRNFEEVLRMANPEEAFQLGQKYEHGGVTFTTDYIKAIKAYQVAGKAGNAEALSRLAYFYENGFGGLPIDFIQAFKLYEAAKAKGSGTAAYHLGRWYEEGINMDEPDYKKAVENYEAGEDKGDAEAAYCLGKIYDEGRPGIQAVPIYAQLHYDNAANKGHKQAHARLNELLRD